MASNAYRTIGGKTYSASDVFDITAPAQAISSAGAKPWYQSLGAGLTAAAPIVGAATGIIDTIVGIYSAYEASKQAEKNRAQAEKMYNEQVAREEEEKTYRRGIAERDFQYTKSERKKAQKESLRQDNYNKYMDYVNRFTAFLNSEPGVRLRNAQAYRSV